MQNPLQGIPGPCGPTAGSLCPVPRLPVLRAGSWQLPQLPAGRGIV